MKVFKRFFACVLLALAATINCGVMAQTESEANASLNLDSVEISLLTCGPGNEAYSLYGHTAIRINDHRSGEDIAVNWGVFSFEQENFVLRFIFGKTDYSIGIAPFDVFMQEYRTVGRSVYEQKLALTSHEKQRIINAVVENCKPENVIYRYNFFYDNCTTRARDIILNNLDGTVDCQANANHMECYRKLLEPVYANYPWQKEGVDILLGVGADRENDSIAWQFLPENLKEAFSSMTVKRGDSVQSLVSTSSTLLDVEQPKEGGNIFTPMLVEIVLTALLLGYIILYRHRKRIWQIDAALLLVSGLMGLVLLAMVFSEHPTVSLNFQILVLNPLNLVFIYPVVKAERQGKHHIYMIVMTFFALAFFLLHYWQAYSVTADFFAVAFIITAFEKDE